MNQKEITSFTSTFRPKCDQLIGSYDKKKKNFFFFRIKKLCEWNVDDFYQSIDDDTKKVMVGKQHHVNQQLKEREKLSTLMGINKPSKSSKVIDGACAKLAKHMNITIEEARKILA